MMAEREIDLIDLLVKILLKWRIILAWMLVGGILMGGFSYVRSYQAQKTQSAALEQQKQDESKYFLRQMTEKQISNVNTVLGYEGIVENWESYLQESVKMQIDALNEPRAELTFQVVAEDLETAYRIEQIYEAAVLGGLSQWLADEGQDGISAAAMSELVVLDRNSGNSSVYRANNSTNIIAYQDRDSFSIVIYHLSEEQCLKLADKVEEYLQDQNSQLIKKLGDHEIRLVNRTFSFVMDTMLLDERRYIQNDIISMSNNSAKLKDEFSNVERQYYNYLITEKVQEVSGEDQTVPTSSQSAAVVNPSVSLKYVVMGMILFAVIYVIFVFFKFIYIAKLQVTDDVNAIYGVPELGVIPKDRNIKKIFGFVDQWILKLRYRNKRKFAPEKAIGLAAAAVKIAAKKEGLDEICCIGCDMQDQALKAADVIQAALKEENISLRVINNVLYDQEAMEQLLSAKGAFLLEKAEGTLYNEVESELEILRRQDIKVLGIIVLE